MIKTVYEVSLFPIEERLLSPFEISSEDDDLLDTGEYKEAVAQQKSAHCSHSIAQLEKGEHAALLAKMMVTGENPIVIPNLQQKLGI